ncbi:hypothetical protein Gohar_013416 [Gossypium harknessii]|uniref:Uncharacterized protein n=1 Tax=Gossypium harknessii TaxID=34285 RepID=A0A7J9H007_9ROSI|nr:hypothetical protein [Gossypium harknessii]
MSSPAILNQMSLNTKNCDNLNEYDEVSDPCETVSETYPNEVVIVSVDNLHSIIHGACHEQSEHIEDYGTRKPGESSNLRVDMIIAGKGSFEGHADYIRGERSIESNNKISS